MYIKHKRHWRNTFGPVAITELIILTLVSLSHSDWLVVISRDRNAGPSCPRDPCVDSFQCAQFSFTTMYPGFGFHLAASNNSEGKMVILEIRGNAEKLFACMHAFVRARVCACVFVCNCTYVHFRVCVWLHVYASWRDASSTSTVPKSNITHSSSVVVRWWIVLDKSRSIHRRGCNPAMSYSERAQATSPEWDRVITSYQFPADTGVIRRQECGCANWDGRMMSCVTKSGWVVQIRQQDGKKLNRIKCTIRKLDQDSRWSNGIQAEGNNQEKPMNIIFSFNRTRFRAVSVW